MADIPNDIGAKPQTYTLSVNPDNQSVHYQWSDGASGDISRSDIMQPGPGDNSPASGGSSGAAGDLLNRAKAWARQHFGMDAKETSQPSQHIDASAGMPTSSKLDGNTGYKLVETFPDNRTVVTDVNGQSTTIPDAKYAKFMNWFNGLDDSQVPQVHMTQADLSKDGRTIGREGEDRVRVTDDGMLQFMDKDGNDMGPPTPSMPVGTNTLVVTSDRKIAALDFWGDNAVIDPNKPGK